MLWSNFFRLFVDTDAQTMRELPALARISRRAMRVLVGGLEKEGALVVEPSGPKAAKVARLTPHGRWAHDAWAPIPDEVERRWVERFGKERVSELRSSLEMLVAQLDFEHPHFPLNYGAADSSVTGGVAVPAKPGNPPIPAHGTDWVPVVRVGRDGDTTSGLSLPALLSQALVAFTIDYEQARIGSLSLGRILDGLPAEPFALDMATKAFGDQYGKLGSGKSGLERHGVVTVKDDRVQLTAIGKHIRDHHRRTVEQIEQRWRSSYDGVADVERALGAIAPDLPADLPDGVAVIWFGGYRVVGG